jgi:hypothetical protein
VALENFKESGDDQLVSALITKRNSIEAGSLDRKQIKIDLRSLKVTSKIEPNKITVESKAYSPEPEIVTD